jgi:hypothetical protein
VGAVLRWVDNLSCCDSKVLAVLQRQLLVAAVMPALHGTWPFGFVISHPNACRKRVCINEGLAVLQLLLRSPAIISPVCRLCAAMTPDTSAYMLC